MVRITIIVSLIFLCLILLSSTTKTTATTKSTTKSIIMKVTTKNNGLTNARTTEKVTSASPSSSFTTLQDEALVQTNKYRVTHCAPSLIFKSTTLNSIAQVYTNKLTARESLVHSNTSYGGNLYYTGLSQPIDINSIKGISFKTISLFFLFFI